MRKQWVKRENIYHKPFYKHKLKMTLLGVIVMAIVFFVYQVFYIRELQEEIEHKASVSVVQPPAALKDSKHILRYVRICVPLFSLRISPNRQLLTTDNFRIAFNTTAHAHAHFRGIRLKDYDLYNPVVKNTFFCLKTGQAIPFIRVNDNYCDCEEDGSDETETNACINGVFYCTFQKR